GILPAAALGDLVAPFGVRALAQQLTALARRPNPFVLIEGATGTGKELLAKYVATILGRTNPYAAVNIAGIADGVFESQLFGHVAGAFSDARVASPGILAAHEHGAVFLDEIGSLALPLQSKLLRLLDQREILPVGASQPRTVDVLVIAATNGGLDQAVAEGRFRADLLARLAIARLELPPLRSRPEDLFTVAQKLASRHQIELDPANTEVEAIERMLAHDWPRNVRELEATLRQAATLDPRPGLRLWCVNRILGKPESTPTIALTEAAIEEALALEGGNETAAARRLGVTRGKLRRHLARKEPS
ncbi:MAG: sigma 54-interacting transcriptional regulator, partial [Deltaproteobacteria bacterium]|nr:sigma 54-interacting transcriptional regulator [Deltaproteobacteria bacterium]